MIVSMQVCLLTPGARLRNWHQKGTRPTGWKCNHGKRWCALLPTLQLHDKLVTHNNIHGGDNIHLEKACMLSSNPTCYRSMPQAPLGTTSTACAVCCHSQPKEDAVCDTAVRNVSPVLVTPLQDASWPGPHARKLQRRLEQHTARSTQHRSHCTCHHLFNMVASIHIRLRRGIPQQCAPDVVCHTPDMITGAHHQVPSATHAHTQSKGGPVRPA